MSGDEHNDVSKALVLELGGGELVSEGGFTLDQSKALDKLGSYRLADADTFMLLFVEAAVLFECTAIEITQDGTRTTLDLMGVSLREGELRRILDAPFERTPANAGRAAQRRLDGQRAMAFGLVAAAGLERVECALESYGPEEAFTLSIEHGGGGVEVEPLAKTVESPRTRLVLHEPVSVVERANGELERRAGTRLQIVAARARAAQIIVRVDGKRYDGLRSPDELQPGAKAFKLKIGEGVRGRLGYAPVRRQATIVFIANGIVIEEVELEGPQPGIAAIVDAGALTRDLSHYRLRRDADFDAIVAATREQLEGLEPSEDPLPLRLPGVEALGAGAGGANRVLGFVSIIMGLAGIGAYFAMGYELILLIGGLIGLGIGARLVSAGKGQSARRSISQAGLPGIATIDYVLTRAPLDSVNEYERVRVRASVEAPGLKASDQTLTIDRIRAGTPIEVKSRYYARIDPTGQSPAVIEHE